MKKKKKCLPLIFVKKTFTADKFGICKIELNGSWILSVGKNKLEKCFFFSQWYGLYPLPPSSLTITGLGGGAKFPPQPFKGPQKKNILGSEFLLF